MHAALTERQEEIKALFTAKRGYWNAFWDGILRLDAEFFAAYTAMSSHPWEHGTLEPKGQGVHVLRLRLLGYPHVRPRPAPARR